MHDALFSSTHGLWTPDASGKPSFPSRGNQHCLQMLPHVPWGVKLPLAENRCSRATYLGFIVLLCLKKREKEEVI